MKTKRYIEEIIEKGEHEHMEELSEMLDDLLCDLKENDYKEYLHYKYRLHTMTYGEHLSKELAHEWVSHMKNKDGTTGEHWSCEQTSAYNSNGYDKNDFYAVMNMMYSDYYSSRFDTTTYANLAKDWLGDNDVNASEGKTLKYYMYIVC
jgi:hypothetical protein